MKKPKRKYILYGILLFLVLAQFIRIDKSVPDYDLTQDFLALNNQDASISSHIKNACYDCHSYESEYPWYADIAPVSWFLKGHINGGRKELNFSLWGTYSAKKQHHKMEECVEMVEQGLMPLKSYKWAHPEANLDNAQTDAMISFFKQQEMKLRSY